MSLYDTYLDQAKELHKNEKKWRGTTVVQYIPLIDEVRKKHNIETMLDYGCGKAQNHPTYWKAHKYDPAIPEYSNKPDTKFDLVISTYVLEHIPEEFIDDILSEIFSYATKFVFLTICCREAREILPNGMNAHATVKPKEWWNAKLAKYENYQVCFTE